MSSPAGRMSTKCNFSSSCHTIECCQFLINSCIFWSDLNKFWCICQIFSLSPAQRKHTQRHDRDANRHQNKHKALVDTHKSLVMSQSGTYQSCQQGGQDKESKGWRSFIDQSKGWRSSLYSYAYVVTWGFSLKTLWNAKYKKYREHKDSWGERQRWGGSGESVHGPGTTHRQLCNPHQPCLRIWCRGQNTNTRQCTNTKPHLEYKLMRLSVSVVYTHCK